MSIKANSAHRRSHVPVFAALGDATRIALVTRLSSGQNWSIAQLTEGTRLTRQAVTKHLRVLEHAGIVCSRRQGRENLYELEPEPLQTASAYLDSISERWDRALARLKVFVEEK